MKKLAKHDIEQKKLIFINRYFYPDISATSQLLSDLAFDLAQDQNVHIITSSQRYDDPSIKLPSFEVINHVQIHRLWTSRFGRLHLLGRAFDYLTFYTSAAWQLWRLVSPGDVVIAKTDPPLISIVASVIVKRRGAVLVNWLQDIFPEVASALGVFGMRGRVFNLLQFLRNRSLQRAQINVVLGELMAKRLARLGLAKDQIAEIHNWADGDNIQPLAKVNNPLAREWGLQDKFVVGYSGNMGRAHEFATLLEAAEQLAEDEKIIFLLIGNGCQREWIGNEVARRKLVNVIFRPYQPRECLGKSLTVADVHLITLHPALEALIVPSKFYGIAAAGRPVLYIGDKEGEIPRVLSYYDCGITVGEKDSEELANQIRFLAENQDRCQQMGINARELFDKLFDKPKALALWREVLFLNKAVPKKTQDTIFTTNGVVEENHVVPMRS
jgi:glycosyltransferase involved in cell wall biosynthesis